MTQRIYKMLRREITTLRLSPGKALSEENLAKRFKLSRTPVREALRRLSHEGLVELIPRKGAFVSKIGLSDVREIFQIREAMEGIAARIAAPRIDEKKLDMIENVLYSGNDKDAEQAGKKLHELILEHAENKRLLDLLRILRVQLERMYVYARALPDRDKQSREEHKKIVKSIRQRDPALAEGAVREHIVSTMQSVIRCLST